MKINLLLLLVLVLGPTLLKAQQTNVTCVGLIQDSKLEKPLPFVNVQLLNALDSTFVTGSISNESGTFQLTNVVPSSYVLKISFIGYQTVFQNVFVGAKSNVLNWGVFKLLPSVNELNEVVVEAKQDAVSGSLSKKTFDSESIINQSGGTALQVMQNLPGVTINNGAIELRGSNKIMVLINGKQTAITGFGNQNGLDNLPASVIDKIEIINNPTAKYDANGTAGIINIVLKDEHKNGFNGKIGLSTGLGALWEKQQNLPGIRSQYVRTPKINPSVSLNYRKNKFNLFFQLDNLYTKTLNRNEFVTRVYSDGPIINQQLKRNRNTNFFTSKLGFDYSFNSKNTISVAALVSQESIKDYGDQPFFDGLTNSEIRLWQFLEDEVLSAIMLTTNYEHKFNQLGRSLTASFNYTFDRENEKYFFTNSLPLFTSNEWFHLIADQQVADLALNYTNPLKIGLLETGFKVRNRTIPTNMVFYPSALNSVLDTTSDGQATYNEFIPAVFANYNVENKKLEAELGIRIELVDLKYTIAPNHSTYTSNGYSYFQPFPNARLTYKLTDNQKISAFYNRRVNRPDEVDIRIFPKYDDAELIKVGNPALVPQFTNKLELGYKSMWKSGYIYAAAYHSNSVNTITRIATTTNQSNLIYNVSHNAGKSNKSGVEMVYNQQLNNRLKFNANAIAYYNKIDSFSITNLYPIQQQIHVNEQFAYSGNVKLTVNAQLKKNTQLQVSAVYLAPDIIPQGKIDARFSIDAGCKTIIQKGKGEIFCNATDLLNTLVIHQQVFGDGFTYTSSNYYETQVIRIGYNFKF